MKNLKVFQFLLMLSFAGVSWAQQQTPSTTAPWRMVGGMAKSRSGLRVYESRAAYREEVVRSFLEQGNPLSEEIVQLERMGDEAAVSLVKILGTRPPLSDTERGVALDILQQAYGRPDAIMDATQRQPRATLFLLEYLSSSTQDQAIKEKASAIRQRIGGISSTLQK